MANQLGLCHRLWAQLIYQEPYLKRHDFYQRSTKGIHYVVKSLALQYSILLKERYIKGRLGNALWASRALFTMEEFINCTNWTNFHFIIIITETHVKMVLIFKIVGASPLRGQSFQESCRQNR